MQVPDSSNCSGEPSEDEATRSKTQEQFAGIIRSVIPDTQKERLFSAYYDDGKIQRKAAERLLGSKNLKTAEENAEGAERLFDGDTSRFLEE